jgi:hypothetical protein
MKRLSIFLVALAVCFIAAAPPALPEASLYSNEWITVSGGGTKSVSGSLYQVGVTAGQAATGEVSGATYTMRLGYWQWGCCSGRTGDVDFDGNYPREVDSSDLGTLVNYLFAPAGTVHLKCEREADVDAAGGPYPIDSTDLGTLVNFLFAVPAGSVTLPWCR